VSEDILLTFDEVLHVVTAHWAKYGSGDGEQAAICRAQLRHVCDLHDKAMKAVPFWTAENDYYFWEAMRAAGEGK
jgi:hypothetical protein